MGQSGGGVQGKDRVVWADWDQEECRIGCQILGPIPGLIHLSRAILKWYWDITSALTRCGCCSLSLGNNIGREEEWPLSTDRHCCCYCLQCIFREAHHYKGDPIGKHFAKDPLSQTWASHNAKKNQSTINAFPNVKMQWSGRLNQPQSLNGIGALHGKKWPTDLLPVMYLL